MDSGHWTGINEEEKYQPGSLIKVMVMLVYLKLAEANPEVLNQYLYYEPNEKREQFYEPKTILSRGSYPVQELIKKMLVDSDNDALFALKKYPKVEDEMNNLNEILGMPPFTADDYLSPKAYSSLYRILYSGTYLSRSHSELALRLLTATNFTSGLIAGLPKDENILVAHKFGERTEFTPEGEIIKRELHDCGIIYYPPKPYFLCIMSKGRDFGDLEKVLTGISRLIYTEISAEN
jgi:beta-lactamase class A